EAGMREEAGMTRRGGNDEKKREEDEGAGMRRAPDLLRTATGQDGNSQRRRPTVDGTVGLGQRVARLGLAGAAAVAAAGAFLQLRKRLHAARHFAADVGIGHGIAVADVHGAHKNANANHCQYIEGAWLPRKSKRRWISLPLWPGQPGAAAGSQAPR